MSVCDTFRNAETNSNPSPPARILNGADILSIGFDHDTFLRVLGQCPYLLKWSVAFGPVL